MVHPSHPSHRHTMHHTEYRIHLSTHNLRLPVEDGLNILVKDQPIGNAPSHLSPNHARQMMGNPLLVRHPDTPFLEMEKSSCIQWATSAVNVSLVLIVTEPFSKPSLGFNKGFRPVHASTFDATPRALAPGDPSHPCKRCWRHYSRPYTAALSQLDWHEAVETNFQRPISDPNVVSQSSVPFSSPMNQRHHTSPPVNVRSPPPNFGLGYPGQRGGVGSRPPMQWMQSTPAGGVIYEPGDPRIGGRLCPRCHGSGRTRVFILETEACNLCQGIGRVF